MKGDFVLRVPHPEEVFRECGVILRMAFQVEDMESPRDKWDMEAVQNQDCEDFWDFVGELEQVGTLDVNSKPDEFLGFFSDELDYPTTLLDKFRHWFEVNGFNVGPTVMYCENSDREKLSGKNYETFHRLV